MELKVHTCDVRYADTDGEVMVQADGGAREAIDNPGNDRERDQSDTLRSAAHERVVQDQDQPLRTAGRSELMIDSERLSRSRIATC